MDDITEFYTVRGADGRKGKVTSESLELMRNEESNQQKESEKMRNDSHERHLGSAPDAT
jgi:hypothetical protein